MGREIGATNSYESFQATIGFVKRKMSENGSNISDSEIAEKLKISIPTFYEYFDKDRAPDEIFEVLQQEFKDILNNIQVKRFSTSWEFDLDDGSI